MKLLKADRDRPKCRLTGLDANRHKRHPVDRYANDKLAAVVAPPASNGQPNHDKKNTAARGRDGTKVHSRSLIARRARR
jgi:hypothetical protein